MANIILDGLTTDQLTGIIRESVHDEFVRLLPNNTNSGAEYLSRKEVLAILKIDPSTLWAWEKTGYIHSHPFGGRKRYKNRHKDIYTVHSTRTSQRIVDNSALSPLMTAKEQGVMSHQRDITVHPFDGIVVESVFGRSEDVADVSHFILHVCDGSVDIGIGNKIASSSRF